jgi:tripartite ATP-independent transporter DctP family solute receptor
MFKKEVEEKTKGKYEITIFPANQLGNQEEVTEAAQVGTIDIVITSDDKLMSLVPEFGALGIPFLFNDFDHVYRTLNGQVGNMLSQKLETKGVIVVSWLENGFRHITNNRRPVITPADLQGLKIRVSSAKTNMTLFDYCGAAVTNVSFSELYSALQLGTVEAQENPLPNILDKKFYEVQKFLSLSGHVHTAEPMIISRTTFTKLTDDDKKIFSAAGKAASKWAFEDAKVRNRQQLEELRKHISINEIDRTSFQSVVDKVYSDFEGQFSEIVRNVRNQ